MKWIKISERLPEMRENESKEYMVTVLNKTDGSRWKTIMHWMRGLKDLKDYSTYEWGFYTFTGMNFIYRSDVYAWLEIEPCED